MAQSDIRAGRAFVELVLKDKTAKALAAASKRLKAWGEAISGFGQKVLAGGLAVLAPLGASALTFARMGDQVDKMSRRTGISTEALSELGFAAEQSGAGLEDLETSVKKMQKLLGEAANGSKSAEEDLSRLGLTWQQLKDLSPEQQFETVADRLSQIQDPTLRASAAMKVFGKSGTALLPLLDGGAAGIKALRAEARELGLSITPEQAKNATALTEAWNRVRRAFMAVAFNVGQVLAPTLIEGTETVRTWIVQAIAWIRGHGPLIVSLLKIARATVAVGIGLIALGKIVKLVGVLFGVGSSAVSVLGSVLGVLLSPIGLIVAALVGLGAAWLTMTESGQNALGQLTDLFGELKETALATFDGIRDALAAGDLELAASIAWQGLQVVWQQGTMAIRQIWTKAIYAIAGFFIDTWNALQVFWIAATSSMSNAWERFTGFISNAFSHVFEFIEGLVIRVWSFFDKTIDKAALLKQLAEDSARARDKRGKETEAAIGATNAEATKGMAEISKTWEAQRKMLAEDEQRELDSKVEALKKAKEELASKIAEAADLREAAEFNKSHPELDKVKALGGALSGLAAKVGTVEGTFNPFAAAAIGGTSLTGLLERIARADEAQLRELRANRPVFN